MLAVLLLLEYRNVNKLFLGLCSTALILLSLYSWQVLKFPKNAWWFLCISLGCILLLEVIKNSGLRFKKNILVALVGASLISLIPLGFYSFTFPAKYDELRAIKDVQLWLKENTSKDKLIMTPPNTRMWSGFSHRGVFMNWVDLNYPIYVPHLGEETIKRANEYVGDILKFPTQASAIFAFENAYNSWQAADFERISSEYGISHAIVYKDRKLAFKKVYGNDLLSIYDLNSKVFTEVLTKIEFPNSRFQRVDETGSPSCWGNIGNMLSVIKNVDETGNICCVTTENKVNSWLFSGKESLKTPPINGGDYRIDGDSYYKIKAEIKGSLDLPVYLYLIEYDDKGKARFTR